MQYFQPLAQQKFGEIIESSSLGQVLIYQSKDPKGRKVIKFTYRLGSSVHSFYQTNEPEKSIAAIAFDMSEVKLIHIIETHSNLPVEPINKSKPFIQSHVTKYGEVFLIETGRGECELVMFDLQGNPFIASFSSKLFEKNDINSLIETVRINADEYVQADFEMKNTILSRVMSGACLFIHQTTLLQ